MTLPKTNTDNKIPFSGYIEVTEELQGEFEFVIEANRCSLDLKECTKYHTVNFRQICEKFVDPNPLYRGFFSNVKPPLKCPLKPGNYTLTDSMVDLSMISFFPIDGYIWVVTLSLVSSENGSKKKKVAMCVNAETKIVKVVRRN